MEMHSVDSTESGEKKNNTSGEYDIQWGWNPEPLSV